MTLNRNTLVFTYELRDLIFSTEKKYKDDLSCGDVCYILDKQEEIREEFRDYLQKNEGISFPNNYLCCISLLLSSEEISEMKDFTYLDAKLKNFDKRNILDTLKLNISRNFRAKCICGHIVGSQNLFTLYYNNKKLLVGCDCILKKCIALKDEVKKMKKQREKNTEWIINFLNFIIYKKNSVIYKMMRKAFEKLKPPVKNAFEKPPVKNICECGYEIKGNYKQCYKCLMKQPKCKCGKPLKQKFNKTYFEKCFNCSKSEEK